MYNAIVAVFNMDHREAGILAISSRAFEFGERQGVTPWWETYTIAEMKER